MNLQQRTLYVKQTATALGFAACGIAKADYLEEEAAHLETWLNNGYAGEMDYLKRNFDLRLDPRKLVPGAKSVVSLLYNYFPSTKLNENGGLKISKYAYGEDYHRVVKDRLKEFIYRLTEGIGKIEGRAFVDSAPVHERAWASKAGLGWVGKHSLLISPKRGSFFFLAELILDIELEADSPIPDFCGDCTACIDACPTQAIVAPQVVDGSRCISYFTIELKNEIPPEHRGAWSDWIFGCDVCQDVCPWNRFASPHQETRFVPSEEVAAMNDSNWKEITEEVFNRVFAKSPLKRAGWRGLKRNVGILDK